MNRRTFLKLPALLPLNAITFSSGSEHHFQFEYVLGTSMDLVVWTPDSFTAERACRTVLAEIDRLSSVLNTRQPDSEISLLEKPGAGAAVSRELKEVLAAYDYWERRTNGILAIRPGGVHTPRDVDALGKAYIIDRAARAAREAWPSIEALLLNIGGDIVVWGRSCEIGVTDPGFSFDNALPITTIAVRNAAVATSGAYARGAHLIDARNGITPRAPASATVVAPDAVTANALATTLCLTTADHGIQLVESTRGAEALHISSGVLRRTSGFARLEQPLPARPPADNGWPTGYQLTITLPLTSGRSKKRPYVAVWVEDTSSELVRLLAFWGNNSKYYADLATIWGLLRKNQIPMRSVTRATRGAGKYELVWDGFDKNQKPAPLGAYRIVVETNQEHGTYAKQAGTITLGDTPASVTLPGTVNFDPVLVQYGPGSGSNK